MEDGIIYKGGSTGNPAIHTLKIRDRP